MIAIAIVMAIAIACPEIASAFAINTLTGLQRDKSVEMHLAMTGVVIANQQPGEAISGFTHGIASAYMTASQ